MEKLGFFQSIQVILKARGKELAAITLMPPVVVLLIGLIAGQGLQKTTIAVFSQDQGFEMPGMGLVSIPAQLTGGLDKKVFRVITAASEEEAFHKVKEGKAAIALSFPAGLTEQMLIKMDDPSYEMSAKIRLKIDKANPLAALLTAQKIGATLARNLQGNSLTSLPLPIDLSTVTEGGLPNFGAFIMPGLFILILYIISVIVTSSQMFGLKAANPGLSSGMGTLASVKLYALVYCLQAALLFVSGSWVFHITIPGHTMLAFIAVILLVFAGAALGVLASSAFKSAHDLPRAAVMAVLPVILGGVLLPVENLPGWISWAAYLMPPFYAARGYRQLTLYGQNLTAALPALLFLLGIGCLLTLLAMAAGAKKLKEKN